MSETAANWINQVERPDRSVGGEKAERDTFQCDAIGGCAAFGQHALAEMTATKRSPECCGWPMRLLASDEQWEMRDGR